MANETTAPDMVEALMDKLNEAPAIEKAAETIVAEVDPKKTDDVINNLMDQDKPELIEKNVETEEKKGEEKVAETEVKAEEKKTEAKEEPIVIATAESLLAEEGEKTEENKESEELTRLKQSAQLFEDYKDLLTDPLVIAFAEYRKSGKNNYREFITSTMGVDYAAMDNEQLYKQYLKDEVGMKNPDEIQEQWETFDGNTDSYKASQFNNIRQTLEQRQVESLSKFGMGLKDTREQTQQQYTAHMDKGHSALKAQTTKLIGKEWNGMVFTPDMASLLEDTALVQMGKFNFYDPDKGYDTHELITYAMWKKYGAKMVEIATAKARSTATHETLTEVVKPSANSKSVDNAANLQPTNPAKEGVNDLIAGKW